MMATTTFTTQEQKIDAVRQCPYFASLEDDILNELVEFTSLMHYSRGEAIFWEGDACSGLYIIHKGSVKLYKISPNGRELIIRIYQEGTTFNEVPVFDGNDNPINTAALEDSLVWKVEAHAIREAMRKHPEMCQSVVLSLCMNLRSMVSIVEELSFYQVTNRLARLIYQMPQEDLCGKKARHITQDYLAARLGTVREVVARSLRELERSGAIQVDRRQILVTDNSILEAWALGPNPN